MARNPRITPVITATIYGSAYAMGPGEIVMTRLNADGETPPAKKQDLFSKRTLSVTPGRWRLRSTVWPAKPVVVETADLQLDDDVEIRIPTDFGTQAALVGVTFDRLPPLGEGRLRCTAEGRSLEGSRGWSGPRALALGDRQLLVFPAGRYAIVGAVGRGGHVRILKPLNVTLEAGSRRVVRLQTEMAGGVRIPRTPSWHLGVRFLDLAERGFPGHGVVEEGAFFMAWLSNRQRDTTWWMPPGDYTILRRGSNKHVHERVAVAVRAGKVVDLEETKTGLRVRK